MRRVPNQPESLVDTVERQVRSQTFGQIRDLRVEVEDGVVVLHGRVDRYYVKQLAQHAVLEIAHGFELVNEIAVASVPARSMALSRS